MANETKEMEREIGLKESFDFDELERQLQEELEGELLDLIF